MCWACRRSLFLVLTAAWMILIFWFSAAPASESSNMSLTAGKTAARLLVPGYEDWTEEEQTALAKRMDHPVRKAAHAGEYALLGLLILGSLEGICRKGIRRNAAAWVIATLYAATDEFHQLFVAGRSGQVSDVFLDSAGAAAGILAAAFLVRLIGRKQDVVGGKRKTGEKSDI